jgi:hypothetical protein
MNRERWWRSEGTTLVVLLSLAGAADPASAQDPREGMVARASNEFDTARRLQLLTGALDPSLGPLTGSWPVGVQLLAQTLIEEGNDSLAGIYLRWAVRLAPGFRVDTVQFLPEVVRAHSSARRFVLGSGSGADSLVGTSWTWAAEGSAATNGRLQVAAPSVGPGLRASVEGAVPLQPGTAAELAPGSYRVSAFAPGYDSLTVTREVLPGVTTLLEFRPRRSAVAAAEPAAPRQIPAANTTVGEQTQKKKFPVALLLGGVAAAGAVVALAAGGGGGGDDDGGTPPPPPTTGGISLTFPNP